MSPNAPDERSIFLAALEQGSPQERMAYLQGACAGDPELLKRVQELLDAHQGSLGPLDVPPPGMAIPATFVQPSLEHPGTVIGPYKLMEQIGEGGMGIVFVAEQHVPVRRKVALKLIKPGMDTRECLARFEAERQALALMDHPNIARVLDAGYVGQGSNPPTRAGEARPVENLPHPGRPYFVMELVKGVPITQYCDDQRLAPRQRLELFTHVCHAVQHAHQKGIIHRDIKPNNVLVASHDGRPVVKVIDFGVAKAVGQQLTERTIYTAMTQMVGTPLYMSPEQAGMSSLDIDTRTDIYSLGVLLYELLTGTTPFDKERLKQAAFDEMRRIIREEEPQKPSTRISTTDGAASIAAQRNTDPGRLSKLVRGELDWIAMKALEKDRNRRYETANGFAMDVQRYLADEPVQACPPSAAYRLRKLVRRNKGTVLGASLVMAALAMGMIGTTWAMIRATQEETKAIREAGEKSVALGEKEAALVLAKANQVKAQEQETLAKANESIARRRFYASQINLAHQAWQAGQPARVLELLEGLRPKFDEPDLRTFEWYYLWKLCHPGKQLNWQSGQGQVNTVAFSPDGKTLASGGLQGNVKFWEVATGAERATLKQVAAKGLIFSPDGATLAVVSWKHWETSLKLWDVTTVREHPPLPGDLYSTNFSVAFSHDGQTLGVGNHAGNVFLWDLATRQLKRTFRAHTAATLIGFSPDDSLLVTTTWYGDNRTRVWNLADELPQEIHETNGAACVAFSCDGRTVAIGDRLWDVSTGENKATLNGHLGSILAVDFSADGKTLATASLDRTVRLWNVVDGELRSSLAHPAAVHSVAFAPNGKALATGSGGGMLKLWDLAMTPNPLVLPHSDPVDSLAFSPDGRTLVAVGGFPAKIWNVATGQEHATLAVMGTGTLTPDGRIPAGALSPDWASFASRGEENTVKLSDAKTGIEVATLRGHDKTVTSIVFSPDSRTLASGGYDDTVKLWNTATHQLQTSFRPSQVAAVPGGTVASLAFSPDGKTLAAGTQFNRVHLWDVVSGVEGVVLQEHLDSWVWSIAFSPDGKTLAAGNDRGTVRLWEAGTGRQLPGSFQGHTAAIRVLAFSPDGLTLSSGSDDSTARLWDVTTGQERMTLTGHHGSVRSIAFAPDGKTLATGSQDGSVKIWHAATDPFATAWKDELDPADAGSPRAENNHGDRLRDAGQAHESEQAYRRAMPRLEQLVRQFPDVPAYAEELAASHLGLGFVLRMAGSSEAGRQAHDRAIALYDQFGRQFPNAYDRRAELAFAYYDLGKKLASNNQAPQAELAYRQAIELYDALRLKYPTNNSYRFMPALTNEKLGRVLADTDRSKEAQQCYETGIKLLADLLAEFPEWSYYRKTIAMLANDRAALLEQQGLLMLAPGPTLLAPAAGATLDNGIPDGSELRIWEFDWSDLSGATQYHLQAIRAGADLPVIDNEILPSSAYRDESKQYIADRNRLGWRWRVRALVQGAWTDWSAERTFEVAPPDDSRPDLQNTTKNSES